MSRTCTNCNKYYIFNSVDDLCRFCKKQKTDLEKRKKSASELRKKITGLVYSNVSFTFEDLIINSTELIQQFNVKLTDNEIKELVNVFYNKEKKSSERLSQADRFYQELDHANNMIIETNENTIGLYYK